MAGVLDAADTPQPRQHELDEVDAGRKHIPPDVKPDLAPDFDALALLNLAPAAALASRWRVCLIYRYRLVCAKVRWTSIAELLHHSWNHRCEGSNTAALQLK